MSMNDDKVLSNRYPSSLEPLYLAPCVYISFRSTLIEYENLEMVEITLIKNVMKFSLRFILSIDF